MKPNHRPVIRILGDDRYVFFWGTDDKLWQATREGRDGPWDVRHVRVNDEAAQFPIERDVLAGAEPIDPAVTIGRPWDDPVNSRRLYLVVKTSLGAPPLPGENWTNVLYLLEHDTDSKWITPDFVPIRVRGYNPPPLNNEFFETISPRHNVGVAWVANDHSLPTSPTDVDLTKGGLSRRDAHRPGPLVETVGRCPTGLAPPNLPGDP